MRRLTHSPMWLSISKMIRQSTCSVVLSTNTWVTITKLSLISKKPLISMKKTLWHTFSLVFQNSNLSRLMMQSKISQKVPLWTNKNIIQEFMMDLDNAIMLKKSMMRRSKNLIQLLIKKDITFNSWKIVLSVIMTWETILRQSQICRLLWVTNLVIHRCSTSLA